MRNWSCNVACRILSATFCCGLLGSAELWKCFFVFFLVSFLLAAAAAAFSEVPSSATTGSCARDSPDLFISVGSETSPARWRFDQQKEKEFWNNIHQHWGVSATTRGCGGMWPAKTWSTLKCRSSLPSRFKNWTKLGTITWLPSTFWWTWKSSEELRGAEAAAGICRPPPQKGKDAVCGAELMEIPGGVVEDARLGAWCNAVQMEPFFLGSQLIERCKSEQKECQMSQTDQTSMFSTVSLKFPVPSSSHMQPESRFERQPGGEKGEVDPRSSSLHCNGNGMGPVVRWPSTTSECSS